MPRKGTGASQGDKSMNDNIFEPGASKSNSGGHGKKILFIVLADIVEDCGYTSVWDIFSDELGYIFNLPSFPILNLASFFSSLRAGYSFTEASALKQVAAATVPILFIHGSEDNFVQTEMIYRVYEACSSEKEMLVVDGAGHGNSYLKDPVIYFDTVYSFIQKHI